MTKITALVLVRTESTAKLAERLAGPASGPGKAACLTGTLERLGAGEACLTWYRLGSLLPKGARPVYLYIPDQGIEGHLDGAGDEKINDDEATAAVEALWASKALVAVPSPDGLQTLLTEGFRKLEV